MLKNDELCKNEKKNLEKDAHAFKVYSFTLNIYRNLNK